MNVTYAGSDAVAVQRLYTRYNLICEISKRGFIVPPGNVREVGDRVAEDGKAPTPEGWLVLLDWAEERSTGVLSAEDLFAAQNRKLHYLSETGNRIVIVGWSRSTYIATCKPTDGMVDYFERWSAD